MWDVPDVITLVQLVQRGKSKYQTRARSCTSPLQLEPKSPDTFTVFVFKLLLSFVTPLTKIAIVIFYMSIFQSTWSRKVAWALLVFIALGVIATTSSALLRCRPIAYFWDKNISNGYCHNAFVNYGLGAGLAAAQDICLIAFPAFQIGKLQMKTRKKVFVIGMFALGGA